MDINQADSLYYENTTILLCAITWEKFVRPMRYKGLQSGDITQSCTCAFTTPNSLILQEVNGEERRCSPVAKVREISAKVVLALTRTDRNPNSVWTRTSPTPSSGPYWRLSDDGPVQASRPGWRHPKPFTTKTLHAAKFGNSDQLCRLIERASIS